MKELTVKGFQVYSFSNEWPQAFTEMNKMIQEVSLFDSISIKGKNNIHIENF